ncbi:NUDIX domain-containing protein [Actinoallomurus sp. NBC_01490]|uniref:NUDIX domain-containing protein n=1 Tax=Actinoallomurus sp. NBC_01490 TaxID=2903557 RepID=UPI002E316D66|nr:NUDIX domain-containing protein [Actinoallomurus sp. NBC_01490]
MPRPRNRRRLAGPPGPHREETSAGGLVVDIAGAARAALIARYDRDGRLRWSLPKGHIEGAETIEEAAVREVEEETGIRGRIVAPLGSIDYWFSASHARHAPPSRDRRVHKTVHHHLLLATGGILSDADPEVAEVAWVPLAEVAGRLAHADERRLVAHVPEILVAVT